MAQLGVFFVYEEGHLANKQASILRERLTLLPSGMGNMNQAFHLFLAR